MRRDKAEPGSEKVAISMSELVNEFDASIVDEKATKVGPSGIDIAYQRLGNPDVPVVRMHIYG